MSAQSVVISFSKRPRGLGEHRGGYDSSHSWQRPEDLDVAVLASLPFITLDGRELIEQGFQARAAALALSVDQVQAWQQQGNVLGCGIDDPRRNPQCGSMQRGKDILRIQAANTVLTQQAFDGFPLQSAGHGWRGRQLKQRPQPWFVSRGAQLKRLRVEAVKLFAQTVGQPIGLAPEVFIDPGEFPQLNYQRIVQTNPAKAGPIGAQCVTEHEGVAAVVFGAGHAMAVAKAIELLGIDGVEVKPMLDQGFHYRATRNLDRDGGLSRVISRKLMQPLRERGNCLTGMCKRSFGQDSAAAVEHTGLMGLSRPVDADVKLIVIIHHGFLPHFSLTLARRELMPHHPCTGARGATPHWTCTNGRPRRGAGPLKAARSAGRAGRSWRVAEFKLELTGTTKLAEGVAHKVHRRWDRVKHPACGRVDNASQNLLLGVSLNRLTSRSHAF
jgi:hypothetical protein